MRTEAPLSSLRRTWTSSTAWLREEAAFASVLSVLRLVLPSCMAMPHVHCTCYETTFHLKQAHIGSTTLGCRGRAVHVRAGTFVIAVRLRACDSSAARLGLSASRSRTAMGQRGWRHAVILFVVTQPARDVGQLGSKPEAGR